MNKIEYIAKVMIKFKDLLDNDTIMSNFTNSSGCADELTTACSSIEALKAYDINRLKDLIRQIPSRSQARQWVTDLREFNRYVSELP
jgi:hypothetical protein